MFFDYRLRNTQTDSIATGLLAARGVGAIEAIKQVLERFVVQGF
jgi:hypothetical protein